MNSYEKIYYFLTEEDKKDKPKKKKATLPAGLEAAAKLGKGLSIRPYAVRRAYGRGKKLKK